MKLYEERELKVEYHYKELYPQGFRAYQPKL